MKEIDKSPEGRILEINREVRRIIRDIKFEVANIIDNDMDNNDYGYTAYMVAEECWEKYVDIPTSKEEAIIILDDPERCKLDKLSAKLFAELYKKRQLQESHDIKSEKGYVIGYIFDAD